jgi:hypothetical protein
VKGFSFPSIVSSFSSFYFLPILLLGSLGSRSGGGTSLLSRALASDVSRLSTVLYSHFFVSSVRSKINRREEEKPSYVARLGSLSVRAIPRNVSDLTAVLENPKGEISRQKNENETSKRERGRREEKGQKTHEALGRVDALSREVTYTTTGVASLLRSTSLEPTSESTAVSTRLVSTLLSTERSLRASTRDVSRLTTSVTSGLVSLSLLERSLSSSETGSSGVGVLRALSRLHRRHRCQLDCEVEAERERKKLGAYDVTDITARVTLLGSRSLRALA